LGSPLTREPERVAKDVRAGLVSADAAREHYGVVVGTDGEVDAAATQARRSQLGGGDGEQTGQFDFGPLPEPSTLRAQIAQERREFDAEMAARGESGD
jgi:N-methylhydantoinase B